MVLALLIVIACLQAATLVVAFVGTNFTIRAWQLPLIGEPLQAVVQSVLRKSRGRWVDWRE